MALFHNNDGLPVRFGRDQGRRKNTVSGASRLGVLKNDGEVMEAVLQVDLAGAARTMYTADRNNDGTMDGFEKGLDTFIPNGAVVKEVSVITLVAPAGGTSYSLGQYAVDGTTISATSLINAGTPASNVSITADSYVTASTVGTYTAGKLMIVVRYMLPQAILKP